MERERAEIYVFVCVKGEGGYIYFSSNHFTKIPPLPHPSPSLAPPP